MTVETKPRHSPTEAAKILRDLGSYADGIETKRNAFLRQQGWEYVCNTPGSYWMWQKQLPDGRLALVDQSTAIRFEEHWADWSELDDEIGG